jgi:hypothetical protein
MIIPFELIAHSQAPQNVPSDELATGKSDFAEMFDDDGSSDPLPDGSAAAIWVARCPNPAPVPQASNEPTGGSVADTLIVRNDNALDPAVCAAETTADPVTEASVPPVDASALIGQDGLATVPKAVLPIRAEPVLALAQTDPPTASAINDGKNADAPMQTAQDARREAGAAGQTPAGTPAPGAMPVTVTQGQAGVLAVTLHAMAKPGTILIAEGADDPSVQDADPDAAMPATGGPASTRHATSHSMALAGAADARTKPVEISVPSVAADAFATDFHDSGLQNLPGLAPTAMTLGGAQLAAASISSAVVAAVIAAIPAPKLHVDRVEVILSPDELGRVQLNFRVEGDGMRVFVTAERPETLDLLRRHSDQLSLELRQAGYSGASLSFGQWGQQQGDTRQAARLPAFAQGESRILTATPALVLSHVSGQGLDLRI